METPASKFAAFLAIIATSFAAGAFLLAWSPSNYFHRMDPQFDGYVAPRSLEVLIDDSQRSIVTVYCDLSEVDGWTGTGWAIDNSLLQIRTAKTSVMTNHHVVEDCIKDNGVITVAKFLEDPEPARVINFDIKHDLALLETEADIEPLELSPHGPWPGYWVMALGSASGFEGSVALGNVLNLTNEEILFTNNISTGNSGGPLIDNEGRVIGMVTWGMDYQEEQYNGAKLLDTFCRRIIECQYEFDGAPTWFNYAE
jgi:serine protease Do